MEYCIRGAMIFLAGHEFIAVAVFDFHAKQIAGAVCIYVIQKTSGCLANSFRSFVTWWTLIWLLDTFQLRIAERKSGRALGNFSGNGVSV